MEPYQIEGTIEEVVHGDTFSFLVISAGQKGVAVAHALTGTMRNMLLSLWPETMGVGQTATFDVARFGVLSGIDPVRR